MVASAASMRLSLRVGWGCIVNERSSSVDFILMASDASLIRSDASAPTISTPSILLSFLSAIILTNPSVSDLVIALLDTEKGNLPIFTLMPLLSASASDKPTVAISGSVKITDGTTEASYFSLWPAIISATDFHWKDALCASIGPQETSPI